MLAGMESFIENQMVEKCEDFCVAIVVKLILLPLGTLALVKIKDI